MKQLTQKEYDQRALMQMYFVSYYKYTFTFESRYYKGRKVVATSGGSADDIYRETISVNTPEDLMNFEIENCRWG